MTEEAAPEERVEKLEETVAEIKGPPVDEERLAAVEEAVVAIDEGRLAALEEKVEKAGEPTDAPHHDMATDVADKTVAASELHQKSMVNQMQVMMTSMKWFVVIAAALLLAAYLVLR